MLPLAPPLESATMLAHRRGDGGIRAETAAHSFENGATGGASSGGGGVHPFPSSSSNASNSGDMALDGDDLVDQTSLKARETHWATMTFRLKSIWQHWRTYRRMPSDKWAAFDEAFRKWLRACIWSPFLSLCILFIAAVAIYHVAAWRQSNHVDWDVRTCVGKLRDNPEWEFWRENDVVCSRDAKGRIIHFRDIRIDWERTMASAPSIGTISVDIRYCKERAGYDGPDNQLLTVPGHIYIHHADQTSPESVLVTPPRAYHLLVATRYPSLADYCRPSKDRPPPYWADV